MFFLVFVGVLKHDTSQVIEIQVVDLGKITIGSSLHYISDGYVYIGSQYGDSQFIKIHDSVVDEETGSYIEVCFPTTLLVFIFLVQILQEFQNVGPIQDMAIVDLDRQGQCQVVTCSGTHGVGSLCVIRNGL